MSTPDISRPLLTAPVHFWPTTRVDKTGQDESGADQDDVTFWPLLSSRRSPRPPSMGGEVWDPRPKRDASRRPAPGLERLPAGGAGRASRRPRARRARGRRSAPASPACGALYPGRAGRAALATLLQLGLHRIGDVGDGSSVAVTNRLPDAAVSAGDAHSLSCRLHARRRRLA